MGNFKIFELKEKYLSKDFSYIDFKEVILHIQNNFDLNAELNDEQFEIFLKIVNEMNVSQKPLAYILKTKFFYKSEFYVDENVLIPRVETEFLVEEMLNFSLENKNVLDLCCGSGCVGISLKLEEPKINLFMSDISLKALEVCKKNLKKHSIEAQTFCSNFLDFIFENKLKIDFIAINPPYIDLSDPNVTNSVKSFEPHQALFAKNNGMYFYQELFANLEELFELNQNTIIICEFGFNQKKEIEKIFISKGVKYNLVFKKDFSNNWRYFILKHGKNNG